MKKMVLHTKNHGKQFCMYMITERGMLYVDYYLPKSNISVIWEKNPLVKINNVRETIDGRKTKVTFCIHPAMMCGCDFQHDRYRSDVDVMTEVFDKYIRIL